MKKIVLFISICFVVFTKPSYCQTGNSFSGYLIGGEVIFNNQSDFKNRFNFSPAIGLDLHLKRFTLGLEGSFLNAPFNDLINVGSMGKFVPDITGSNKYQSSQLLFGPGFDIISTKKFNINISGMAGLNFVKEASQTIYVNSPPDPSGFIRPACLVAKLEPLDSSTSKLIFSPSMSFKYQLNNRIAVIIKTSYIIKGTSSYSYSYRDLTGIDFTNNSSTAFGNLMERPLKNTTLEKNYSNLFIGIGVSINLWSKDKPKKEKEKDCPADRTVCLDQENFALSGGTPTGGVYSGKGVVNGVFSPAVADTGTHLISYVPPGNFTPCSFKIAVKPRPQMTCPKDTTIFFDSGVFELKGGGPEGGEYSGKGVSEGKFNPASVGGGAHKIRYMYKEEESCEDTCRFIINVMKYYYELSKEPNGGSVEISGDTLNIQFSNSYASSNNIYLAISDVNSQEMAEKKNSKKMKDKKPALYNVNGLNRISIGLKNYGLQPGGFYQLTLSDFKNYYYLNFKIVKPQGTLINYSSKSNFSK